MEAELSLSFIHTPDTLTKIRSLEGRCSPREGKALVWKQWGMLIRLHKTDASGGWIRIQHQGLDLCSLHRLEPSQFLYHLGDFCPFPPDSNGIRRAEETPVETVMRRGSTQRWGGQGRRAGGGGAGRTRYRMVPEAEGRGRGRKKGRSSQLQEMPQGTII